MKMWTDIWMDRKTNKKQTNEQTELHQFRQTIFELEPGNENVDGQTDGQKNGQTTDKRTNEPMELHQFRKESRYDGDLCPCQV